MRLERCKTGRKVIINPRRSIFHKFVVVLKFYCAIKTCWKCHKWQYRIYSIWLHHQIDKLIAKGRIGQMLGGSPSMSQRRIQSLRLCNAYINEVTWWPFSVSSCVHSLLVLGLCCSPFIWCTTSFHVSVCRSLIVHSIPLLNCSVSHIFLSVYRDCDACRACVGQTRISLMYSVLLSVWTAFKHPNCCSTKVRYHLMFSSASDLHFKSWYLRLSFFQCALLTWKLRKACWCRCLVQLIMHILGKISTFKPLKISRKFFYLDSILLW